MNQIKAVLFDMDGVLVNTEPVHFLMWKEAFHNRGLEISYDVYKGCIGTTDGYLMDLIWDHYGRDFRGDKKFLEERMAIEERMPKEESFPEMPGVREMLQQLQEAGFYWRSHPLRPSAGSRRQWTISASAGFSLLNSGENVARSKPAPDIYLDTARRLGVEPAECIVLEDSENGSIAAVSAGMICVGLKNPDSGNQNLEQAKAVIHKLGEFTPELIRSLEKI